MSAACYRCSSASEDVLHSLWSCNGLKEVWEKDFRWVFRSGMVYTSFRDLVKLVFTKSVTAALFATTAWSVSFHRNKTRESTRPLGQIADFARDYLRDCKSLNHSSPPVCKAAPRSWSPPARESWKINFDGAMFGESDEAGVGVIVCNSKGEVKAALAEKISKPPSVEVLELLAA